MTRIALIGIGKIARDAHVPSIAASPDFELVAAVTRHQPPDGIPAFATLTEMVEARPNVDAVSICTPPIGRLKLVEEALALGLDVMIEKPPAATLSEAEGFAPAAAKAGRVFYATWHSREAAAVEPAQEWLKGKTIRRTTVSWAEDVREWHPGQEWIWTPGIGVFDPGINALSVITALLPGPLLLDESALRFPSNKDAPIAATLAATDAEGGTVAIEFDFDQRGPQRWDIDIETDQGLLSLTEGASKMAVDGVAVELPDDPEYARLYRRFAKLLKARESDIDLAPFRLVADAFLIGRRSVVGEFSE